MQIYHIKHISSSASPSIIDKVPSYLNYPLTTSKNSEFHYFCNKSVDPFILGSGQHTGLANMLNRNKLICSKFFSLAKPIPCHQYVLVNRSILYNCIIKSRMTYVLCILSSSSDSATDKPLYFTIIIAFSTTSIPIQTTVTMLFCHGF